VLAGTAGCEPQRGSAGGGVSNGMAAAGRSNEAGRVAGRSGGGQEMNVLHAAAAVRPSAASSRSQVAPCGASCGPWATRLSVPLCGPLWAPGIAGSQLTPGPDPRESWEPPPWRPVMAAP
jgi:hypothetical protein